MTIPKLLPVIITALFIVSDMERLQAKPAWDISLSGGFCTNSLPRLPDGSEVGNTAVIDYALSLKLRHRQGKHLYLLAGLDMHRILTRTKAAVHDSLGLMGTAVNEANFMGNPIVPFYAGLEYRVQAGKTSFYAGLEAGYAMAFGRGRSAMDSVYFWDPQHPQYVRYTAVKEWSNGHGWLCGLHAGVSAPVNRRVSISTEIDGRYYSMHYETFPGFPGGNTHITAMLLTIGIRYSL